MNARELCHLVKLGLFALLTLCVNAASAAKMGAGPDPVEVVIQDQKGSKQVSASDLAWMGDYQPAESLFSHSALPAKNSSTLFSRVFRVTGADILPIPQSLIDLQASVLSLHCQILKYSCKAYISSGAIPDYRALLQSREQSRSQLCETVCMVQIFPSEQREDPADCYACTKESRQTGFEQYDTLHAVVVATITRESFLPMAMRLKWSSSTSNLQLSDAMAKGELPQLEQHIVHDAVLAQSIPRWQPYRAVTVTLQLQGPSVAPFTLGKQNLVLHTLRQLEKLFFVEHQYFRLGLCSHNEQAQQANASVVIVQNTQSVNVGLDTVVMSFKDQIQDNLNKAGLSVTQLDVHPPVPLSNETVADQISAMLGPPTLWQQYRQLIQSVAATCVASALAAALLSKVFTRRRHSQLVIKPVHLEPNVVNQLPLDDRQKRFLEDMANKYARLLHTNLYTGLNAGLSIDLEVCRHTDGTPWVLGYGACGIVYKAKRDGVQDVALKVLAAPASAECQLLALKKEICLLQALNFDANIVQFYGACLDPGYPLLVLEYMEGGDLFESIQRDTFPEPYGIFRWYGKGGQIALDIAKGLVFLHRNKVAHNDLKTKNVLLSKGATVAKISDVGTSRILEHTCTTASAAMQCTFAYAAPEQLLGNRDACDEKVDLFSFGVVLWEIVTQKVPRRGNLRATQVPQECPQAIEDLITDCLSQNPEQRPSAKQVCLILERALQQ